MGVVNDLTEDGEERPLRLLSLDGGGIRGLSSILILKEIMAQVNHDRNADDTLQPWQVFDLIGGTSTGGIIAIMLGRLRMTLEECERAYLELSQKIFRPKRCKYSPMRLVDRLSLSERFDSRVLEALVKKVVKEKMGDAHALLRDPDSDEPGCNVFVCTVLEHNAKPALLRSYDSAKDAGELGAEEFEIWQACRATSAATSYFAPHAQGALRFVDGALAHNNPVFQVAIEADDLWRGRPAVLVSLGTGRPPPLRGLDGGAFGMARALPRLVTQTDVTADSFARVNKWMTDQGLYHRFSADGLVGTVGLGDARKIPLLQTDTRAYLGRKPTRACLEACVDALVHKERAIPRRTRPTSIPDLTRMELNCLQALDGAAGSYDKQRVEVDEAAPGTCQWFLDHPQYVDWPSSKTPALLWVTADAGCGKSVLSSFLIGALSDAQTTPTVLYFFFKNGDEQRRKAHNALCALLHQGILADPSAAHLAATQFSSKAPGAFSESLELLWTVFCQLAAQSPRPVICILDALDECAPPSRDRLIDLLADSFASARPPPPNLKILLTSRPDPAVENRLHPLRAVRLRAEDAAALVARDVAAMVRHRVAGLRSRTLLSADGAALVEDALLRRAGTTFLWAALVLDLVELLPRSRRRAALRELLARVPDDLARLYECGLAAVSQPAKTKRLLQVLLAAGRPLRVEEVNVALSVGAGTGSLRELDEELEPNAELAVKELGGFLVKVSQGFVFFVHETAREFLLSDAGGSGATAGLWEHSIGLAESDALLAKACTTFLLFEDLPRRQGTPAEPEEQRRSNSMFLGELGNNYRDFYAYAAEKWPLHAGRGGSTEVDLPSQHTKALCDPASNAFRSWWYFYAGYGFYKDSGGQIVGCSGTHYQHFAASRGDWAVIQGFLAAGMSVSAKNAKGFDILAVAVATKRWETADRLLDLADPKQMQLEIAMMCAIHHQRKALVERLIGLGVDVDRQHLHPLADLVPVEMSALDAAVNRPAMARVLLDAGAEIKDSNIVKCAAMGYVKDLEILFEVDRARRNEDERLPGLQTALEAATNGARLEARKLILQQSTRLEDSYELTRGFGSAAGRGDVAAIQELLAAGARDDGSALAEATQYAGAEVTELLLAAMDYPQAALDKALAEFFGQIDAEMERHVISLLRRQDGDSGKTVRPHRAVERTFAIGASNLVNRRCLSLLLDRGARLPAAAAHDALLRLAAMNEDLCVFVLENLSRLQKGERPLSAAAYLTVACFWGRERLAALLLDQGADVDTPDGLGVTPLVAAAASGSVGVVRLLVARGAVDEDGAKRRRHAGGGRDAGLSGELLQAPCGAWAACWNAAGVDGTNGTALDAARSKGYQDVEDELAGWSPPKVA